MLVRRSAAEALGKLGDAQAVPDLLAPPQGFRLRGAKVCRRSSRQTGRRPGGSRSSCSFSRIPNRLCEGLPPKLSANWATSRPFPIFCTSSRIPNRRAMFCRRSSWQSGRLSGGPRSSAPLKDSESGVRMSAALALGSLGDVRAYPIFCTSQGFRHGCDGLPPRPSAVWTTSVPFPIFCPSQEFQVVCAILCRRSSGQTW